MIHYPTNLREGAQAKADATGFRPSRTATDLAARNDGKNERSQIHNKQMANVKTVDTYRYPVTLPLELAGKVRTYIKGKEVHARIIEGRNTRKPMRRMTVSDYVESLIRKDLEGFSMDAESRKWMAKVYEKQLKEREVIRQKNIAKRKRPEEKLKSGPKPGKKYPKFLAAMKKLSQERKAAGWKKGPNKKNRGTAEA